jgi:hypothetical protein
MKNTMRCSPNLRLAPKLVSKFEAIGANLLSLLFFKAKVGDAQARRIVPHDALDVLREPIGRFGCNVEDKCDCRTTRSV